MRRWRRHDDVRATAHGDDAILIADNFGLPLFRRVRSASLSQMAERGDPFFEDISVAEAAALDPQARAHVCTVAALEHLSWLAGMADPEHAMRQRLRALETPPKT